MDGCFSLLAPRVRDEAAAHDGEQFTAADALDGVDLHGPSADPL